MNPILLNEFLNYLFKIYDKNINMNEMILSAEKHSINDDYVAKRVECRDLNRQANQLKLILSRIPNEINNRKVFLETIREIAANIKKILHSYYNFFHGIKCEYLKHTLSLQIDSFFRYSKIFRDTLRKFFKDGKLVLIDKNFNFLTFLFKRSDDVIRASICLVSQTNLILKTINKFQI